MPEPQKNLEPVRAWRIHLGAHKTASSHVQAVLAVKRPELLESGIDFIPNEFLRECHLADQLVSRRLRYTSRLPLPWLRGRLARDVVTRLLDPLRAGPDRIVICEEKLLGASKSIFSWPPYPQVERVVPLLAGLARRADVTLFLSIRGFDQQLPSAYVQELKFQAPIRGGFDRIKQRVLSRPPSWFDLVRRIRKAAPGIPLRVWRQEDYRANTRTILSLLCGVDVGPVPEVEDPFGTASPGLDAIRAAEALPPDLRGARRRAAVLEVYRAHPGGGRFLPFSDAEAEKLRSAYATDLDRIAQLDPNILIRF